MCVKMVLLFVVWWSTKAYCNSVRQFSKLNLSDTNPRAMCADGSPAVAYMSLGGDAQDGPNHPWLIWVDGPTNPVSMSDKVSSTALWPDIVGFTYGPFGDQEFAHFSMSVLMYCSDDYYLSQSGRDIMATWTEFLDPLMARAPSVVAGGATVGALGLVANIALFEKSIKKLSLLLDSPFFTPPILRTSSAFSTPSAVSCASEGATHAVYSEDSPNQRGQGLTPCCLDFLCSSQMLPRGTRVMLLQSLAYATSVNDALLLSSKRTYRYSDSQLYNLTLTTTKRGALVSSALRSAANARPNATSFIAYSCIETSILSPFGNALCMQNGFQDFSTSFADYGCSTQIQTATVRSDGDYVSVWSNSRSTWRDLKVLNSQTFESTSIANLVSSWIFNFTFNNNQDLGGNGQIVQVQEACHGMNCNPSCTGVILSLQVESFTSFFGPVLFLILSLVIACIALIMVYAKKQPLKPWIREDDPAPEEGSASLDVAGLTYWNKMDFPPSLKHVTLSIKPGSLVGIIGGSGSGKSTLLEILSGRRESGSWTGEITMGFKKSVSFEFLARNTGIVRQSISPLLNELTLMENLEFCAMLRVQGSCEFVTNRIDSVLENLQLGGDLKQRKVANLSGGQRKRAEVALELLTQPKILFLDEPTSALDARTALLFMEWIAKIAQSTNRSIVLSIHQPREEIWKLFDQIILLEKGFLIYSGPPFELPSWTNPADFAVETGANRRNFLFHSSLLVGAACKKSERKRHRKSSTLFTPLSRTSLVELIKQIRSFLLRLVAVHPPWKLKTLRSVIGIIFLSLFVALLLSSIFWSMDSESVRTKALAFLVLVPAFLSNSFVVSYICLDFPIYLIERSNYYVTPMAYCLHHVLHLFIYIVWPFTVFPLVQYFLLWGRILGYFDIHMFNQIVGFSQICFLAFLSFFVFSCFLLQGNQSNAMIMNSSIESFFALFSGFLAPLPSLTTAPIRWLSYFSPALWGYVGVAYSVANIQFPGDCGPSTTPSESSCYISQSGNSLIHSLGFDSFNPHMAFFILIAWILLFSSLSWLVLARPWHKGAVKLACSPSELGIEFLGKIADREQAIFIDAVNDFKSNAQCKIPSETHSIYLDTENRIHCYNQFDTS